MGKEKGLDLRNPVLDAKLRHFNHAPLQMAATLRLEMPWHEGRTLPVKAKKSGS